MTNTNGKNPIQTQINSNYKRPLHPICGIKVVHNTVWNAPAGRALSSMSARISMGIQLNTYPRINPRDERAKRSQRIIISITPFQLSVTGPKL